MATIRLFFRAFAPSAFSNKRKGKVDNYLIVYEHASDPRCPRYIPNVEIIEVISYVLQIRRVFVYDNLTSRIQNLPGVSSIIYRRTLNRIKDVLEVRRSCIRQPDESFYPLAF